MQTALCLVRRGLPQRTATAMCAGVDTYAIARRRGDARGIGPDRKVFPLAAAHTVVGGGDAVAELYGDATGRPCRARRDLAPTAMLVVRNPMPVADAQRDRAPFSDAQRDAVAQALEHCAGLVRTGGGPSVWTWVTTLSVTSAVVTLVGVITLSPAVMGGAIASYAATVATFFALYPTASSMRDADTLRGVASDVRQQRTDTLYIVEHSLRSLGSSRDVLLAATQLTRSATSAAAAAEYACPVNAPLPSV